jgi:hypothetical protein
MDDLVRRLRAVGGLRHDGATRWYVNPDGPEAATRIEMMERALKHVAEMNTDTFDAMGPLISCTWIARAALEGKYYD